MSAVDWERAKEVFSDLRELNDESRATALAQLQSEDTRLFRTVTGLLAAHERAAALLEGERESPPPEPDADAVLDGEPAWVGPFELVNQLGHGAFGVVYRARQREPVERFVALKLLRRRGDAEMLAAFRAEAAVLARMEHPGIARLLDVGLSADARPYVVMELVDGVPIVSYCVDGDLDIATRLQLFVDVCRAVHYAHQQAVLHRDLKPSNVLVGTVDGSPVIKVIDFGIAQSLSGEHGIPRRLAGTPRYMSPEQLRGDGRPDVRSDVFSLGVLLSELLTGVTPSGADGTSATSIRPSELVPASAEPGARQTAAALRGDLDEIVAHATAPTPEGRYDSAAALADDVRRHLQHRPIEAGPARPLLRLRKFVRRNRAVTIGAALATGALLFASVASFLSMRAAIVSRDAALWQGYIANIAASTSAEQNGEYQRLRTSLANAAAQHRGWEWRFLSSLAGRAAQTIATDEWIYGFDQSVDGRLLVSGGRDGTVRIWDAQTGQRLQAMECEDNQTVYAVAFNPDGTRIAAGSGNGFVRIWTVQDGRLLHQTRPSHSRVSHLAFTATGALAVAHSDGSANLWDLQADGPLQPVEPAGGIHGVATSLQHARMATFSDTGDVRVHDHANQVVQRWEYPWRVTAAAFNPTGDRLAIGSNAGSIIVRALDGGPDLLELTSPHRVGMIRSIAFSPDGTRIAANQGLIVVTWDAHTGALIESLPGHEEAITGVYYSPDGSTLRTASWDRTIRFWEVGGPASRLIPELHGHTNDVLAVDFAPEGDLFASASRDHTLRLWIPELAEPIATLRGHSASVYDVAFAPDGRTLASGAYDHTVRLWSVATGTETARLEQGGPIWSVAFAPDGRKLACGGDEGVVRIWDVPERSLRHNLTGHRRRVTEVAFSPDGRFVASASRDHSVRVWDAETGALVHDLRGHDSDVFTVLFTPDARQLYSGSRDRSVRLWDVRSGECLAVLGGHGQFITSLALLPAEQRLAAGAWSGELLLWDTSTHDLVNSRIEHRQPIRGIGFSPDGKWLATASTDETTHLLDSRSPDARRAARENARKMFDDAQRVVASWISAGAAVNALPDRLVDENTAADGQIRRWLELAVLQKINASRTPASPASSDD